MKEKNYWHNNKGAFGNNNMSYCMMEVSPTGQIDWVQRKKERASKPKYTSVVTFIRDIYDPLAKLCANIMLSYFHSIL